MKYINFFESRKVDSDSIKSLDIFLDDYNENKKRYSNEYDFEQRAKNYKIPTMFIDEFSLLYRLYNYINDYWGRSTSKSEINYIKKEVKKRALISIKQKFEEDTENYYALKKVFDDRPKWYSRGSFQGISNAVIKNIFYLFDAALKNPPEIVKNMNKYNL